MLGSANGENIMANRERFIFELKKGMEKNLLKAVTRATLLVNEHVIMNCPVGGGFPVLRNSIEWEVDEETLNGRVFTNNPYAAFVEYGTRPHIIRPKEKQALKFKIGNENIFAKRVFHPGTSGQYFMRRALWDNIEDIKKIFAEELSR